ncbi:MAG: TetR/AcrR family transcriptional regulator [Oscillospiraceae bacterium]
MDLRISRTKNAIKTAFLELRSKKAIERITVTELTRLANINKATFYLHYSDIYALSDEIENSVIDDILMDLKVQDKFFDAPKQYANEIFNAVVAHSEQLNMIFSGSRNTLFSDKIEERIKSLLYSSYPSYYSVKNDVILSFLIQGLFHTVKNEGITNNMTEKYNELSKLCSMVIMQTEFPSDNSGQC